MCSICKVDDVFYWAVGGQHHLHHLKRSLSARQVKRRGLVILQSNRRGQVTTYWSFSSSSGVITSCLLGDVVKHQPCPKSHACSLSHMLYRTYGKLDFLMKLNWKPEQRYSPIPIIFPIDKHLVASFLQIAKDDGICFLFREHRLYTTFHNALWDIMRALTRLQGSLRTFRTALKN